MKRYNKRKTHGVLFDVPDQVGFAVTEATYIQNLTTLSRTATQFRGKADLNFLGRLGLSI